MNNKTRIWIMIIILTIIFVNITTLTANENTTTNEQTDTLIKNTYHQTIHTTKNNDTTAKQTTKNIKTDTTISVTSYQELYETIEEAKKTSSTKIINLEKGNYNITTPIELRGKNGPMTITINGQNNTINGNSMTNFITVPKSNKLIIGNMTIENTNSTAGSAIFSRGLVNISNIQFNNCYSESWISNCGGAIYNSGTMNIDNSTFLNNIIITDTFGGGAIFNNGKLNVENSIFQENHASNGSAIFSLNAQTNISNSNFTNNHANITATIYNFNSTVNIKDSQFNGNTATYSSILETIDNGSSNLENTTITNHLNSKNIINNHANTNIYQCNISNNSMISNIIENKQNINIINSSLSYNNASNLIENKGYLTLEQNSILENNASEYILKNIFEYEDSTCSINFTYFNNNYAKSILYDINSTTIVYDSTFINNTSVELFNGTTDTFKIVSNNTYLGNNLSSKIESETDVIFNYDENITLQAYVKALPIYNTTIETGTVTIYDEDEEIGKFNITNGTSNMTVANNIFDQKIYSLTYTDNPNYRNNTTKVHVKTVHPEYEVQIIVSDNHVSYNDNLNYTIYVKNIGEGNASNLYIENILPNDVEIIGVNDESYDKNSNQWFIQRLDSMSEVMLNVTTAIKTIDDFNISIEIPTPTDNLIIYNKDIHILKPDIQLDFNYTNKYYRLNENYTLRLNVTNNGQGISPNIIIYIKDDENNVEVLESGFLKAQSSKTFEINKTAKHIGSNKLYINFVETLTNQTNNYSITFIVQDVSVKLENITVFHGDTINITAVVENITHLSNKTRCVFKINGLTIKEHNITIEDNKITLENYIVPFSWSRVNYRLEVKVQDIGFNKIIQNYAMINMVKKKIISKVNDIKALPGDIVNLTAKISSEDGKVVDYGYVKFKINGKTIDQIVSVKDGFAYLTYHIPDIFHSSQYTISLVYGENKRYYSNRNSSILELESQECEINITNSTYIKGKDYYINATIYGKKNGLKAYSGKIIFKLNDVTFTNIIYVMDGFIDCKITKPNINNLYNITICYSGNNVLQGIRKTISFINDTSN